MNLANLLNIQISRNTAATPASAFGIELHLGNSNVLPPGTSAPFPNLPAVLAGGFGTGTPEYIAASRYFGQKPSPNVMKIGQMLAKVAQILTVTPAVVNNFEYSVEVDGGTATYLSSGSATLTLILNGLQAAVNALAGNLAATIVSNQLVLTAQSPGFPSEVICGDNLTLVTTVANVGVVESIAAISLLDNAWYMLSSSLRGASDIIQLATYIEALPKMFGFSTSDANSLIPGNTSNILHKIMQMNVFRTWGFYSADSANFPECAEMGARLTKTPGSETWAFAQLALAIADNLSDAAIAALKALNANYFVPVTANNANTSTNIFLDGKVMGNEYIDIIRLIDAITTDLQVAVFGVLINPPITTLPDGTQSQPAKVPFTNGGVGTIQAQVNGVLLKYQKTNGIAPDSVDVNNNLVPGFTVQFPNVNSLTPQQKATRSISGSFAATLAGAIQALQLTGTVTT